MIVELAGLPGSGKTTIARRLEEADRQICRQVVTASPRTALRHPAGTALQLIHAGGIGRHRGWPAWARLWLVWCTQCDLSLAAQGVALLEEGVTHRTWRALYRHPGLRRAPWPALLTLPHPLLLLEAPRDLRRARVEAKARRGRVNDALALPGASAAWDAAEALMAEIVSALPAWRVVVRVETSGGVTETMSRVVAEVASLRETQRQQAQAQR